MSHMDAATQAVIALGSNLGDRVATLTSAITQLERLDGITVDAVSGLVESHAVKPDGVDETSPNYLNAVAAISTTLSPYELLAELQRIESELGRVRIERWGDRTLDLDIIVFGELESTDELLLLPHPRAWQRPFVVVPWLDIDPAASIPGHGPLAALDAAGSDEVWQFDASPLHSGDRPS